MPLLSHHRLISICWFLVVPALHQQPSMHMHAYLNTFQMLYYTRIVGGGRSYSGNWLSCPACLSVHGDILGIAKTMGKLVNGADQMHAILRHVMIRY